jgi:hypothetical protein
MNQEMAKNYGFQFTLAYSGSGNNEKATNKKVLIDGTDYTEI